MRVVISSLIRYHYPGAEDLVKRQDNMPKHFEQDCLC